MGQVWGDGNSQVLFEYKFEMPINYYPRESPGKTEKRTHKKALFCFQM